MIRVFFGEDRKRATEEIRKIFGGEYEVIEGAEISYQDMPSIFLGESLFSEKRKILIRDLSENKEAFSKLLEFLGTEHEVIVFESKLDQRTAEVKALKEKVEVREFNGVEEFDRNLTLRIFNTAFLDGKKAVLMVEEIEEKQDPYMFLGALAGLALKKFEWQQGRKEKRVLQELSRLDILMKTTSISPWSLLKGFLLQVSSL